MKTRQKTPKAKKLSFATDFPAHSTDDWRKAAEALLKDTPFDILRTQTPEEIELQPIYFDALQTISVPARQTAALPAANAWRIAQEIRGHAAGDCNRNLRHYLEADLAAVNLILDDLSRRGLDVSEWQAGAQQHSGLSLSSLRDLEIALQDVDLANAPVHLEVGSSGLAVAAFLAVWAQEYGRELAALTGSLGCDPLAELIRQGSPPCSTAELFREMACLTSWASQDAPGLKTVLVDARPYHEAGANAVQELACALATGVCYIRELQERGDNLSTDDIVSRMRFAFAVGPHFFMEIAKLRAARRLWSQIVREFGSSHAQEIMDIHVSTCKRTKSALDSHTNMLRATIEALAAVFGGCDSLHIEPFDRVAGREGELARRVARNTHLILREESHLDTVFDPAAGSWCVETLTQQLTEKAWAWFQEIERHGGMLKALESGFIQDEIMRVGEQSLRKTKTREYRMVGVNTYPMPDDGIERPTQEQTSEFYREQAHKFASWKERRNSSAVQSAISRLSSASIDEPSAFMNSIIDTANNGATLGEIYAAIRKTKPDISIRPLKAVRLAEPFESLRLAAFRHKEKHGKAPQVFLVKVGPLKQHKARADFAADFFQIGGFETVAPAAFANPEDAAQAVRDSDVDIAVLCSTDETYPDIVPNFVRAMNQNGSKITVVVAGYPKDEIANLKQAGVDEFIHKQANAFDVLRSLLQKSGVAV